MEELYEKLREQEPRDSIVRSENLDEAPPKRVGEPIIDQMTPASSPS